RSLPNMTVLSPCDENQTKLATISAIKQIDGPCYIRYGREPVPNFTDPDDNFIVGKAKLLRKGKDISIIATGSMVYTALMVADELEKIGISASVLNIHTIKPIDSEAIIKAAQKTKKIVSLEEHQIFGGLGSAVAEVLSQNYPVKLKIIGMPDCFGESGNPEELLKKYGLDPKSIFEKIINFINN
ncbi:MAG: transketolase C-terminal domain-containing protein, partial [Bacteroidales bacterium]|nr:transketolase C-terminal domain-containing protein [Bacteroidales bacterium]